MSQPELVSLEKTQYDAFMKAINEIVVNIDGENITLNADFGNLEELTKTTNEYLNTSNHQWMYSLPASAGFIAANTKTLWEDVPSLSALMINRTLTDIRELESVETEHLATRFFSELGKIDQVLSTINSAVDTVQTAVSVVQAVLEVSQKNTLDGMLSGISRTNELLTELVDGGFEAKVLETIAESVFEINAPNILGAELTLDACGYDPLGFGPIACAGVEGIELALNGVEIEPIIKEKKRINKSEQTIIRSDKHDSTEL